jgi:hypothetical protein
MQEAGQLLFRLELLPAGFAFFYMSAKVFGILTT